MNVIPKGPCLLWVGAFFVAVCSGEQNQGSDSTWGCGEVGLCFIHEGLTRWLGDT